MMIAIVGKSCIIAAVYLLINLKKMRRLFLLLSLTQLIVSCSNDSSEENEDDNNQGGKYFVVGSKYGRNAANNFSWLAAVWVDGVPTVLPNAGMVSVANAIAFYNNDTYIAGTETLENGSNILKLWKNNTSENLTDGTHRVEATDIAVNQGNVYIVGNEYVGLLNFSIATVWKNGQTIHLTDETSEANAVYVYNNDVYVTGYKVIFDKKTAVVWKNGTETVLYSEEGDLESIGTDVYADDKNMYVTGNLRNSEKSAAILWKNKIASTLSDENNFSEANALFVHNSDVYVIGCDIDTDKYNFIGKIWKNGILVNEINGVNPISITINNNKIYAAAFGLDDKGINQEDKIWESNLNNLDFTTKYKFPNDKINAVLVK